MYAVCVGVEERGRGRGKKTGEGARKRWEKEKDKKQTGTHQQANPDKPIPPKPHRLTLLPLNTLNLASIPPLPTPLSS